MSGFSSLAVDPADQPTNRHEKSLGLLTTKFVSLLQKAEDGVLDLKVVSYFNIQFCRFAAGFFCHCYCAMFHIEPVALFTCLLTWTESDSGPLI